MTDTPDARPLDFWVERSVALAERQGVTTIGPSATVDEGRYLVDGDLTIDGGDRLTVDLSAGNVTILVDGNVTIRNGQLRVRNPVGDHRLRILTTGNLAMKNGQAYVEPMGSVDARHLQVYGTSDMQVGLVGGSTYFEGFLYAPREDPVVGENPAVLTQSVQCDLNGDEADVCISTGNTAVEGAIHAGPAVVKQSTTVEYDPGLSSVSFSVSPGTAGMAPLDHLNLAVRGVGIRQD